MLVMLGLDRYDPINGQIAELKYPCRLSNYHARGGKYHNTQFLAVC
jgi:hypothetical protein